MEIQGTAEHDPFSLPMLLEMHKLAAGGIAQLIEAQREILKLDFATAPKGVTV